MVLEQMDVDGDGYPPSESAPYGGKPPFDCDETDPKVHPEATETCGDNVDNDCSGEADDVCTDPDTDVEPGHAPEVLISNVPSSMSNFDVLDWTAYAQDPDSSVDLLVLEWSINSQPVDDIATFDGAGFHLAVGPLAPGEYELTVRVTDPTGLFDEATLEQTVFDGDLDDDGFEAATYNGGDCDDTNSQIHPELAEICDAIDNDCLGGVDNLPGCHCGWIANNEVWTSDIDHTLSCTVEVPPESTLVIEEGAHVSAVETAALRVHGSLQINGNLTNPVVLTGLGSDPWAGLTVTDGSADLHHLQVENGPVALWNGTLFWQGGSVSGCRYDGTSVYSNTGLSAVNADVVVNDVLFHDNEAYGAQFQHSTGSISNSEFSANGVGFLCDSECIDTFTDNVLTENEFYPLQTFLLDDLARFDSSSSYVGNGIDAIPLSGGFSSESLLLSDLGAPWRLDGAQLYSNASVTFSGGTIEVGNISFSLESGAHLTLDGVRMQSAGSNTWAPIVAHTGSFLTIQNSEFSGYNPYLVVCDGGCDNFPGLSVDDTDVPTN